MKTIKATRWLVVFDRTGIPGCYELSLGEKDGSYFSQKTAFALGMKFLNEHGKEHGLLRLRWYQPTSPDLGMIIWVNM